jgi:hypothetical protein
MIVSTTDTEPAPQQREIQTDVDCAASCVGHRLATPAKRRKAK